MGGFVPRKSVQPALRKIREGNDAVTKFRLLDARRQLILDSGRQRPLIRLWDKKFKYLGTVALEKSAEYERLVDDSGVGNITLRWSDWLADLCAHDTRVQEDLHITIDQNPNQRSWRTRLGYRVTAVRAVKHDDGTRTVELDLISLREHAKHILLGATPFSAPEFQPLKSWVWFQNLRSNLAFTTFLNLARSYWPILSLPTSLFDPVHWLTTRAGNLSPLHWPVQVQFVNMLTDTSRFLPLAAKWQDLHTIAEPLMDDAGVILVDYIWLTEDKDSPHPELAALIGETLARPTRNCVILAFEDKSGVVGPTGTAIDGALNLIGATLDSLITEIVLPLDVDGDGITDPFFRRLLGVAPKKPSLVWRDCEYSGLIASEHKMKRATSQTVWTGGHSPTWLNQIQTFLIKYALSQISALIAQGPFASQVPGSPGLEEVYQGQLDDCVSKDTIVHGPDGDHRIDVLAAREVPFRVWSLTPGGERVAATAVLAFKKGSAELFEYVLSNGYRIKATSQHRFLTAEGYVRAENLGVGAKIATANHSFLRDQGHVPVEYVSDDQYLNMGETAALVYSELVEVRSLGDDDFYDMHVPGWENYSANGIWNHNTLFAYQKSTNLNTALWFNDYALLEGFEQGNGYAYVLSAALTIRQGIFKRSPKVSFTMKAKDGEPNCWGYDYNIGDRGLFEIDGIYYTEQIRGAKWAYDENTPIDLDLTIGRDRDRDPFEAGLKALADGWNAIGSLIGGAAIAV